MSVALNVGQNSRIHVTFTGCVTADNSGFHGFFRVCVDGAPIANSNVKEWMGNNPGSIISLNATTDQLAAGAHTVTVEWATNLDGSANTTLRCNPASNPLRWSANMFAQECPAP